MTSGGGPFGDGLWQTTTAERLGLGFTLSPRTAEVKVAAGLRCCNEAGIVPSCPDELEIGLMPFLFLGSSTNSELQEYDDKLRHYAERRIALDLDDDVKVNYAKFGDLLAEVKAVTGMA